MYSGYRIQPTLQSLLSAGFSVLAMNMPACGSWEVHDEIVTAFGLSAMQYFVVMAVQAMNYWDAHGSFREYDMIGLSGGGWTTTILAAMDPRIKKSFPVAGSMPGLIAVDPGDADDEQLWAPYYAVAGYLDHYIMGSAGVLCSQVQILNYNDFVLLRKPGVVERVTNLLRDELDAIRHWLRGGYRVGSRWHSASKLFIGDRYGGGPTSNLNLRPFVDPI